MNWTQEQLEQLPQVYRDFLMVLKPVVDSRAPHAVLRITGIPFSRIYDALSNAYEYDADQVRGLADQLKQRELVTEDSLGFFAPTARGEALLLALTQQNGQAAQRVPSLPEGF